MTKDTKYITIFNGHGLKNFVGITADPMPTSIIPKMYRSGIKYAKFKLVKVLDLPVKIAFYEGIK